MSRFAALLDWRPGPEGAGRRVEADLARRTGGTPCRWGGEGIRLWQGGAAVARSFGPLVLAGDLGLTDLADLRRALGARPGTDPAALVLAAWRRWGEGALDRLCGAFAFALWDARVRQLTLVRDRFGIRPLAYAAAPGRLVVAGDLSTVLAGLDAPPPIDRDWVAGFLSGQADGTAETAWQGLRRLPPGHLMTAGPDGATAPRAWYRLDRSAPSATADPAPALRAALAHATAEACADAPTAAMLSGGLDSSTLALLSVGCGGPVPRPALSLRYRDPALDEGRYIDEVLRRAAGGLSPVSLPGETAATALFDIESQLDWQDQPVFAPGLDRNHRLCRAAADLGCTAILDGHGGDEVIGGGFRDIALIARAGRWPLALSLAARQARLSGEPPAQVLAALLAAEGRRGFGRLGRWALRDTGPGPQAWRALVHPDLVRDTRLVERVRAAMRPPPWDPALPEGVRLHAAMLTGPIAALAFETLGRAAQAQGVTPRYPFYDHRVVELCVWQPESAKVADGYPRALLRAAMRGLLPEAVRLRRDKTDFLSGFWAALRQDPQGRIADLRADPGPLRGWVDAAVLRADADRLARSAAPDPQTAFRLWRALWLAAWIDRGAAPRAIPAPASVPAAPEAFFPSDAPCPSLASDR